MHGQEGGSVGDIDDKFARQAMDNFGAFILGRQHVWSYARTMAGRLLEGLVGRKPAVSCGNFRLDTL
jgi:hypothetical protein